MSTCSFISTNLSNPTTNFSRFTNLAPNYDPEIIVPAFRLAQMWSFSDLRDHLLPLVKDALGCVDKIVLAREAGIQEWLAPAYVELCQRAEPINMEEATKLGMHSTVMINRMREQFRPSQSVPNPGRAGSHLCQSCIGAAWTAKRGNDNCGRCHSQSSYYYYFDNAVPPSLASSSPAPPNGNKELESQVKKWVEGGCVTE